MNRKRVVLAALVGVLCLCLVYAYYATPRQERVAAGALTASRSNQQAGTVQAGGQDYQRIDFDYLAVDVEEFPGAQRDIFRYAGRRQVVTAPKPEPKPVAAPVVAPVIPAPDPIAVVTKALSRFTFLGFLEKDSEKTVFLSSGGDLFLVKSGERFGADREFLVESIKGNLLQVRHREQTEPIEIELIEQKKLNTSVSSPARNLRDALDNDQTGGGIIAPQRRSIRLAVPRRGLEPEPEINEELNPEQDQDMETPVEGDVLEGENNGANQ